VALEYPLVAVAENDSGDLGRQEALEPAGSFDLCQLIRHALLEHLVPTREVSRLGRDPVMQLLDPQHRFHTGDQRGLVHRLRQILVGAGIEASHDVWIASLMQAMDRKKILLSGLSPSIIVLV
jgi:hypothetical protein